MQAQWFRQGQGFLVVYSIVNKKSFTQVRKLREKIERIKDTTKIPMVLVSIYFTFSSKWNEKNTSIYNYS